MTKAGVRPLDLICTILWTSFQNHQLFVSNPYVCTLFADNAVKWTESLKMNCLYNWKKKRKHFFLIILNCHIGILDRWCPGVGWFFVKWSQTVIRSQEQKTNECYIAIRCSLVPSGQPIHSLSVSQKRSNLNSIFSWNTYNFKMVK